MDRVFLLLLSTLVLIQTTETAVPTFSGIDVPINVGEGTVLESHLDTFTVTDPDGGSITSFSHTGDAGEFDFRQDVTTPSVFTLYVLAGAGLSHSTTPLYSLTLTCIDSGGETASQVITVNVIPNQPPAITAPTGAVTVGANDATQQEIYTVVVTDAEGDAITCDMPAVSPATTAFGIWKETTDYKVYLLDNPDLSSAPYTATIRCSDPFGSSTTTLTIEVTPNVAPTFDNLPTPDVTFDASTTPDSTVIFTVTTSDADSSTVTYSLSVNPTTDVFTIDSGSGEITTYRHLKYALSGTYDITVSADDQTDTSSATLRVLLDNVNVAPVIDNLDDSVTVNELIPSGVLFTLNVYDPDVGENITFLSWLVLPSTETDKFSFNSTTRELSLAVNKSFDFESRTSYTVQFYVSDNKAQTGPHTLTIYVTDGKDHCVFDRDTYHVSAEEDGIGLGLMDPEIVITDDDVGDSYDLSIQPAADGSNTYFDIDPKTGVIVFAVNYDVDGVHPPNVTLTLECKDSTGITGTATASVTIVDINDNDPDFGSTGYTIEVDQYVQPGTAVTTITANDIDSGANADVKYSWVPTGSGSTYYQLSSQGRITLLKSLENLPYGQSYRFLVTATDHGDPVRSGTVTVDMVYTETTTTTTTVTTTVGPGLGFFDDPGNLAVVVLMGLLGAVLLGLLAYLVLRYCRPQCSGPSLSRCKCCKLTRKPKPRPLPNKPAPEKDPFDFWHDSNDRKQAKTPRIPTTGSGGLGKTTVRPFNFQTPVG